MSNKDQNIEEFISVTGADKVLAANLLEVCNGNLEMAVNMFLEGGNSSYTDINSSQSNLAGPSNSSNRGDDDDVDDDIRAPIPQQQAILVEDPYHAIPLTRQRKGGRAATAFDQFRDFKKETEEQEEELKKKKSTATSKGGRKRLHELFRPPIDIIHAGDFQSARNRCCVSKKWLLISIQNAMEFACQILNRDVWSNKVVRDIIAANFILWQVYHDSDDGMHYNTFYPVKCYPHIAVIDPRTGERMVVWENFGRKPTPEMFAELATLYLSENQSLNQSFSASDDKVKEEKISIIDDSEDAQLEAALKASLNENHTSEKKSSKAINIEDSSSSSNNSSSCELITSSDDDDNDAECTSKSPKKKKRRKGIIAKSSGSENDIGKINGNCIDNKKLTADKNDIEKEPSKEKTEGLGIAIKNEYENNASSSTNTKPISNNEVSISEELDSIYDLTDEKYKDSEIASILLRLPDNTRKQISIPLECTLNILKHEVSKCGYPADKYELLKSFPRQNLSTLDQSVTLKKAGIHKKETLFVQDR